MDNERKKLVIDILAQNEEYLTAEELANRLKVSTRTVIRDIKELNSSYSNEKMILSKKGHGYRLNKKINCNFVPVVNNFSPVQRRNEVMLKLLYKSPISVSIEELFKTSYVSNAVIRNDLNVIKKKLARHKINLERMNNGYVRATGLELTVRKEIYNLMKKNNKNLILGVNQYDSRFINNLMSEIEEKLKTVIPYPYNVNLVSHIYILIKRYRQFSDFKTMTNERISDSEKIIANQNQNFFNIAQYVVKRLGVYLGQEMPVIEIYYVFQYLMASRLTGKRFYNYHTIYNAEQVSRKIVTEVNSKYDNLFEKSNDILIDDLSNHMEPMINRIKSGIQIENSLIGDILVEYPKLFKIVKSAVNKIIKTEYKSTVSDEEIGFIVLYFAKYQELYPKEIKVLVME